MKPVINLLHGWGMNAAVFDPLSERLRDQYQINAANLPGYGGTPLDTDDFDEQVSALAKSLPEGAIAAWSLGGLYAIELVRRFPQRFTHLILIASNPCFVQRADWSAAMPREMFEEFAASLAQDWPATIRRFIGLQLHGAEQARELIRQISALVLSGGAPQPRALDFGLQLLLHRDARQQLSELHQPVLVILGRRDKLVPASLAAQLPALNPALRVECLAHSAHAPFLSHPAEFIELLNEFIESTAAG